MEETNIFPSPSLPLRRVRDDRYQTVENVIGNDHLQFDLWHDIDLVLRAAINLSMSLLAAMTVNFRDSKSVDAAGVSKPL